MDLARFGKDAVARRERDRTSGKRRQQKQGYGSKQRRRMETIQGTAILPAEANRVKTRFGAGYVPLKWRRISASDIPR